GTDVVLGHADLPTTDNSLASSAEVQPTENAATGNGAVHNPASPQDRENAIRQLSKSLDIEAVKKSNVVQITCNARSPELAQAVVDKLIDYFQEDYITLNRTPGAQEFLSQQTEDTRRRLQAKEEELRNLKDT